MSQDDGIKFGMAIPGPREKNSVSDQGFDYSELIGRKATLLGRGENESLDAELPRSGTLQRQIKLDDWGNDWLVFQFETPVSYENNSYGYCLVRARWVNTPIGSDFCPVFLLLDSKQSLATKSEWLSKDFAFVSWGEIRVDSDIL